MQPSLRQSNQVAKWQVMMLLNFVFLVCMAQILGNDIQMHKYHKKNLIIVNLSYVLKQAPTKTRWSVFFSRIGDSRNKNSFSQLIIHFPNLIFIAVSNSYRENASTRTRTVLRYSCVTYFHLEFIVRDIGRAKYCFIPSFRWGNPG